MSARSFLKGLKKPKAVQPRTLEEINKEYNEVVGRVGMSQYQAFVHTKEVENLNQRLLELNKEAHQRNKLDAEAAAKAAPKAEVRQQEEVKS